MSFPSRVPSNSSLLFRISRANDASRRCKWSLCTRSATLPCPDHRFWCELPQSLVHSHLFKRAPDCPRTQPFHRFKVNPSWLAVKPLHDTILYIDPPAEPITVDDQLTVAEANIPTLTVRDIHLSILQVPVTYEDVLAIVPGLHARPPIIPPAVDPDLTNIIPPPDGFDLIFHVGVTGRGPLRMERVGHKFGYNMKDATGCLAPIVRVSREESSNPNHGHSEPSPMERMERARLSGYDIEAPVDGAEPPKRGFGKGYETFPEEIYTDIDVEKLVHHLKKSGIDVRVIYLYFIMSINIVLEANILVLGCRALPLRLHLLLLTCREQTGRRKS